MSYKEEYISGKEKIAKLFRGKHHEQTNDRIPPGQHVIDEFRVLDLGVQPDFDRSSWRLKVYGSLEGKKEYEFSYGDVLKMPSTKITADFHCVTSWTKFDINWKGISFKDFIKIIKPKDNWKFIIQESMDGYTTNTPREDLEKDDRVILAYELEGKPLPKEHGWPLRFIIPHLYGWKGAKFLKAIKFIEKDEPGFWETRGYNNRGDIWKEERYS